MYVLVTYDVNTEQAEGKRRLRKVAKLCVNYGQRVQNSVFECMLEPGDFSTLKLKLKEIINDSSDSIRFYYLGRNWQHNIESMGKPTSFDFTDSLII